MTIIVTSSGSCYFIVEEDGTTFIKRSSDTEVFESLITCSSVRETSDDNFQMSLTTKFLLMLNNVGAYNKIYKVKGKLPTPAIGKRFEFCIDSSYDNDIISTSPVVKITDAVSS